MSEIHKYECEQCGHTFQRKEQLRQLPVCAKRALAQQFPPVMQLTVWGQEDPIKEITDERGKNYGPPIKHFPACQHIYESWEDAMQPAGILIATLTPEQIDSVKHGVHWIIDKLVRAAHNPMHKDNWDDIEGYARCIKDALELEEK